MGRVILIASGKGGVGKSVIASNLGATYAERGIRVALVDMNVGLRNLDIYMGLENRVVYDIADVLSGLVPPRRAMVKDRRFPALYFLATTHNKEKFTAGPSEVAGFYGYLKDLFDIILVDGPAGLGAELKLSMTGIDKAVVVTTPEYVSLRDADHADGILRAGGIKDRVYVVNKVNRNYFASGLLPTVEVITSMMKIPLLGVVQYDDEIHILGNCGTPAVCRGDTYISRNFEKIADRLLAY
jgi:septum site-determining protein MinD